MNDYDDSQFDPSEASNHYGASYGGYTPAQPGPEPERQKQRRGMGPGAVIALCLVCTLLAGALGAGGTYYFLRGGFGGEDLLAPATPAPLPTPEQVLVTPEPAALPDGAGIAAAETAAGQSVYELATKQVVGVTTEITYTNFFGQISAASVSGTGFIISDDGYIMTNNHVIDDARRGGYEVSVLTYDGTEYTADIVGYDEANDIAVLKIDANGLTPVTMGDAGDIVVGRTVYPVGNPLGELNFTMTTGIISATDRAITTDQDNGPINMFQIDAAVNEGNSGGPVYDGDGQVIGVVTAKTSATGVEGLGFAIPIEDAAHIAEQLIEFGYVTDRASMGISSYTLPDSVADRYGLVPGAYVTGVQEGGPAEAAGLREQDVITAVDGKTVAGSTELTSIVRTYDVGDTAELTVWRAGETLTLSVTFGESQKPVEDTPEPQQEQRRYYGDMEDFFRQFFGGF